MIEVIKQLRVAANHPDLPLSITWKSWTSVLKGRCSSRRITGILKTYLTKCLFEKPLPITAGLYNYSYLLALIGDDFFKLASRAGYFIVGDRDGDYICVTLDTGTVWMIPGWSITERIFEKERRYKSLETFLRREIKRARDVQKDSRQRAELQEQFEQKSQSDPNAVDGYGRTLFELAFQAGDFDAIRHELDRGFSLDALIRKGKSPLSRAINMGDAKIIQLLLERGCDPNAFTEQYGLACIHIAAIRARLEVIRILHRAGADLGLVTERGETPLGRALMEKDREDVVRYILEQGVDPTPSLFKAVINRRYVALLLEFGADPNVKGPHGNGVLRSALFGRSAETVEQLLEAGANVDSIGDVIAKAQLAPDMKRVLQKAGVKGLK